MTNEEIVEGLKLLEDNMVHFDELQNDKGEWIDVHELLFEAIQALSQEPICDRDCEHCTWTECPIEPCDDAISREAVLSLFDKTTFASWDMTWLERRIKMLPSVTPKQKSGKWIEKEGWDGDVYYECSVCGEPFCLIEGTPTDNMYNYCPNCGAKMVEPQESEDKE